MKDTFDTKDLPYGLQRKKSYTHHPNFSNLPPVCVYFVMLYALTRRTMSAAAGCPGTSPRACLARRTLCSSNRAFSSALVSPTSKDRPAVATSPRHWQMKPRNRKRMQPSMTKDQVGGKAVLSFK